MSTLSNSDVKNLLNALDTAVTCGIESIIIEDGQLRGFREDKTCAIISDTLVPDFPQKIGFSRVGNLRQRLMLLGESATIVPQTSEIGEIISIDVSSGRSKAKIRCTGTKHIRAPKKINDEDFVTVTIKNDEIKFLMASISAMGSEEVVMSLDEDDGTCTFKIQDLTRDSMVIELENKIESEFSSTNFAYESGIFKILLKSLQESDEAEIVVRQQGTIKSKINGHTIIIIPRIGE